MVDLTRVYGNFFNPCFRGAVGKSVGLLAANPILNSAKSSTDFPTTPCTYGLGQVDTGDGEIQRIIPQPVETFRSCLKSGTLTHLGNREQIYAEPLFSITVILGGADLAVF